MNFTGLINCKLEAWLTWPQYNVATSDSENIQYKKTAGFPCPLHIQFNATQLIPSWVVSEGYLSLTTTIAFFAFPFKVKFCWKWWSDSVFILLEVLFFGGFQLFCPTPLNQLIPAIKFRVWWSPFALEN
jgi:hypothetical protein